MVAKISKPGQFGTGPLSILCTALRLVANVSRPFLKQMLIDRSTAAGHMKCTMFRYFDLVSNIYIKVACTVDNVRLWDGSLKCLTGAYIRRKFDIMNPFFPSHFDSMRNMWNRNSKYSAQTVGCDFVTSVCALFSHIWSSAELQDASYTALLDAKISHDAHQHNA